MSSQGKRGKNDYQLRKSSRSNKPENDDFEEMGVAPATDDSVNTSAYDTPSLTNADPSPSTTLQHADPPIAQQLNSFMAEMRGMIASLNNQIKQRFDDILLEISGFKRELAVVKSSVADIDAGLTDASDRLSDLESVKMPDLSERMKNVEKDLNEKLLKLEIHDRKQNLLVYGVSVTPNENVFSALIPVFMNFLRVSRDEAEKIQLVNAHRLPTSRNYGTPAPSNQPPPIIVRFAKMSDRDKLLHAFEQPRRGRENQDDESRSSPPRIAIRTDLPPSMKRDRGRLAATAFKLRKTQHLATSIRVVGTKVVLFTRKRPSNGEPPAKWMEWKE